MKIKGKKALVTRAATYIDAATQWVVTIDKIDKSKILMSSRLTEFELKLYKNEKGEYFLEGDYTSRKASSTKSMNSSLKLQRTSTTLDDKDIPADAAKE